MRCSAGAWQLAARPASVNDTDGSSLLVVPIGANADSTVVAAVLFYSAATGNWTASVARNGLYVRGCASHAATNSLWVVWQTAVAGAYDPDGSAAQPWFISRLVGPLWQWATSADAPLIHTPAAPYDAFPSGSRLSLGFAAVAVNDTLVISLNHHEFAYKFNATTGNQTEYAYNRPIPSTSTAPGCASPLLVDVGPDVFHPSGTAGLSLPVGDG